MSDSYLYDNTYIIYVWLISWHSLIWLVILLILWLIWICVMIYVSDSIMTHIYMSHDMSKMRWFKWLYRHINMCHAIYVWLIFIWQHIFICLTHIMTQTHMSHDMSKMRWFEWLYRHVSMCHAIYVPYRYVWWYICATHIYMTTHIYMSDSYHDADSYDSSSYSYHDSYKYVSWYESDI